MPLVKSYAAQSPESPLTPYMLERREPGPTDVEIDIAYCGVCHSDIHSARNEWGGSRYPLVVGHEIVGKVSRVGAKVKGFKQGDSAGVGCMVDSCRKCGNCRQGLEQHCERGVVFTYNGTLKNGERAQGGYSKSIVVDEAFVLRIPPKMPLGRAAPLLCAGITTYSPLRRFNLKKGQKLGVMGLGGLGHMAVKLGAAMGAEVTMLSRSPGKQADAKRLGAHDFALTSDPAQVDKLWGRFDLIIDTISADHDLDGALGWLKTGGVLVLVGGPPAPQKVRAFSLLGRKTLAGSLIGGIAETQEMLEFCEKHKCYPDVELIEMASINQAYERTLRGDVRYRFVIDLKTL